MKGNNKAGVWMVLGAGFGTAIGAAFQHVGLGTAFGAAIGLIIGAILSNENTNGDKYENLDNPDL